MKDLPCCKKPETEVCAMRLMKKLVCCVRRQGRERQADGAACAVGRQWRQRRWCRFGWTSVMKESVRYHADDVHLRVHGAYCQVSDTIANFSQKQMQFIALLQVLPMWLNTVGRLFRQPDGVRKEKILLRGDRRRCRLRGRRRAERKGPPSGRWTTRVSILPKSIIRNLRCFSAIHKRYQSFEAADAFAALHKEA